MHRTQTPQLKMHHSSGHALLPPSLTSHHIQYWHLCDHKQFLSSLLRDTVLLLEPRLFPVFETLLLLPPLVCPTPFLDSS